MMLKIYKKILKYVPEMRKEVYLSVVFAFLSSILNVFSYYYTYKFLKEILNLISLKIDYFYISSAVILLFVGVILYYLAGYFSHKIGFRLETNLRKKGIEGLSKGSFFFFSSNSSGKIRKIIDDNAKMTHMTIAHLIPDGTVAIVTPVAILVFGFFMSYRVGIILLIFLLISLKLVKLMAGDTKFMELYYSSLEKLSNETVEYIRGIQVIKIFNIEVEMYKNLYDVIKDYSKYAYGYSLSCQTPYTIFQGIFYGILCFLVIVYSYIDIDGKTRGAELLIMAMLIGILFIGFIRIMYLTMYIFQGKTAIEKLEELYEKMNEKKNNFGDKREMKSYNIEFQNVTFSYDDEEIIKNLTFKLEENKVYAIIGSSGSGKSTLAKLIAGFYKLDRGNIKIGGINIEDYTEDALLRNITFLFQEAKLFQMSIYENVKLGNPLATKEEVLKALSLANCDSILDKFEERENTIIGTEGIYLSGGEKQRICIARALLKNSKIIIFDEANASIDAENEYELQEAFSNLMKNKTVIMIAHRLSSIKKVDEIIVMEDGKIIERGRDKELMKNKTKYYYFQNLYNLANEWRI